MEFVVGCGLEEFKIYNSRTIASRDYRTTVGEHDGAIETGYVMQDPSHVILFKEKNGILGHAIWHESNTDEHRKGSSRDESDKKLLKKLLGGTKEFVELHELWLGPEHRGKGYGRQFFEFFEKFIISKGFGSIVFYAFDPAAIAICRQRGYKEAYGAQSAGKTCFVFYLPLKEKLG